MHEPTAAPAATAPATMHDVARAAGVSAQTVSRVVNDAPAVRESTRRRVLDAVARLGYERDDAASRLARRPRRTGPRPGVRGPSAGADHPPGTDHPVTTTS